MISLGLIFFVNLPRFLLPGSRSTFYKVNPDLQHCSYQNNSKVRSTREVEEEETGFDVIVELEDESLLSQPVVRTLPSQDEVTEHVDIFIKTSGIS
jgi:hypothetical protein